MTDKSEFVEVTIKARFFGAKADAQNIIERIVDVAETEVRPLVMQHNVDNKCDITVTDKTKR
jgi:hypothetical protein